MCEVVYDMAKERISDLEDTLKLLIWIWNGIYEISISELSEMENMKKS